MQQYANTADLYSKTETIPITIDIQMLQALMPRFAQGPPTLDRDVYGSMILNVHCFLSLIGIEKFIIRQPPIRGKDDYDSEKIWISDGLPSSSRRRRRGDGKWELGEWRKK